MQNTSWAKFEKIMAAEIPFPEKVKQAIDLKMQQTKSVSYEFINDIYRDQFPELIAFIQEFTDKNLQRILAFYTDAQKIGDVRPDIKPEFILYFHTKMTKIVNDEQLKKIYPSANELILEMLNLFFYGIIRREK